MAFGPDSEAIEKEFKIPVINIALHAGLGLEFIINELIDVIQEKDIVILSIEYFLGKGMPDLILYTNKIFPHSRAYTHYTQTNKKSIELSGKEFWEAINFNTEYIINRFKNNINEIIENWGKTKETHNLHPDDVYSRPSFNQHGDVVGHLKKLISTELKSKETFTIHEYININNLNRLYEYALKKKVRILFMYPAYPSKEFQKNEAAIRDLSIQLKEHLKIPIINTPEDFVFPEEFFFDTVYHLNAKGKKAITMKLISLLKKTIKVSGDIQGTGI